jgi:protein required for attachment to host cells
MPLERKTIWLLIADSARARLFTVDRRERCLAVLGEWSDDVASGKTQDIQADRPGRTFDSAGQGRHAMEPTSSPKGIAKSRFVAMLADNLAVEAKRQAFDELHVIAAPRTLGELRELLDASVKARLASEEAKDLTQLSRPELEKLMGSRFWPA